MMKHFLTILLAFVFSCASAQNVYNSGTEGKVSKSSDATLDMNNRLLDLWVRMFEVEGGIQSFLKEGEEPTGTFKQILNITADSKIVSNGGLNIFPVSMNTEMLEYVALKGWGGEEGVRAIMSVKAAIQKTKPYKKDWSFVMRRDMAVHLSVYSHRMLSGDVRDSWSSIATKISGDEEFTKAYFKRMVFVNSSIFMAADKLSKRKFKSVQDFENQAASEFLKMNLGKLWNDAFDEVDAYFTSNSDTSCSGNYKQWRTDDVSISKDLKLNCSKYVADLDNKIFMINGQKTLSTDSINGLSYKITISNSDSKTKSTSEKLKGR